MSDNTAEANRLLRIIKYEEIMNEQRKFISGIFDEGRKEGRAEVRIEKELGIIEEKKFENVINKYSLSVDDARILKEY